MPTEYHRHVNTKLNDYLLRAAGEMYVSAKRMSNLQMRPFCCHLDDIISGRRPDLLEIVSERANIIAAADHKHVEVTQ